MRICVAAVGMAFVALSAFGGEFNANGCSVEWNGRSVTLGNSLFSKRCVCIGGRLQTASFKVSSGSEWQTEKFDDADADMVTVVVEKSKWSPVGAEGLRCSQTDIRWRSSSIAAARQDGSVRSLRSSVRSDLTVRAVTGCCSQTHGVQATEIPASVRSSCSRRSMPERRWGLMSFR